MNWRFLRGSNRSRTLAVLLLCLLLAFSGCGQLSDIANTGEEPPTSEPEITVPAREEITEPEETSKEKASGESTSGNTVEAVTPEEILSEEELEKGPPEYRDWNAPAAEDYSPETAEFFVTSNTSTGAIPAVKPFNFGQNPGGPEDKTLYLSVPAIGLVDIPIYNSLDEEELVESAVHVPATGFPWQEGANVYVAGHRLGYPNTGSYRIFYELDELSQGDEILLEDSAGEQYRYVVNETKIVGPENVEVMEAEEGKSLVTLQSCTLPDYSKRIIVQGELTKNST